MGGSGGWSKPTIGGSKVSLCEDINVEMYLANPQMDIIENIDDNNILIIEYIKEQLLVYTNEKIYIGALIDAKILNIIKCMEKGYKFRGTFLSINGAEILITIYPLKI
ncbi:MAG: hypothetical protein PHO62_02820 [Sulfurimonas sp.]|uniref:hypothetical protein n=1 Tax=Sulfurimonas sp. TaxID=2022749 RepID=UPI00261EC8DA|nr:hypothetical protein [Sulfurimonas sp.]MDD5372341.1 hypothetical protein [Sulfurimonas sp.]